MDFLDHFKILQHAHYVDMQCIHEKEKNKIIQFWKKCVIF